VLHQRLGETQLEARRPAEALVQLQIADQLMAAAGGDVAPWRTRERQLDRAEALIYLARTDEASTLVDAVSAQLADDPTHQWPRVALLRTQALRLAGLGQVAVEPATAALRRAQDGQAGPRNGAALRVVLAQALLDTEQAHAAHPLLLEALAQYETAQGGLSPRVADALVALGRADLALGNPDSALASLKRAHEFWLRFDPGNLWAAEAAIWYGRARVAAGQVEQGLALIEQARPRLQRSPFTLHRQLAVAYGVKR
jgi:tetratricopeptide (TPR) repeat protein